MASNVWILRSLTTSVPGALANGALAYTANGDVLYIGSNGAIQPIGGKRFPGILTANQALVTNSTSYLDVMKTANLYIGSFTVNAINAVSNSTVLGLAANNELTTTWAIKTYVDTKTAGSLAAGNGLSTNATNFFVLPGNSQVVANATGTWIDQSQIDHNSLSNYSSNRHIDHTGVAISAGNGLTGGGNIDASRTLSVSAGDGIVANSTGTHVNAANGIIANSLGTWVKAGTGVTVNSSGVCIGQAVGTASSPTFTDMTLTGNLIINGTLTSINVATLAVTDSNIKLANGQIAADALDIGVFGVYGNSTVTKYTGLFRDVSDSGKFKLFKEVEEEPGTTVNTAATGYAQATLVAAIESSSVTITGGSITGIANLAVNVGGTGVNAFTNQAIMYASGTGVLGFLTGSDGGILQWSGTSPVFGSVDCGTFARDTLLLNTYVEESIINKGKCNKWARLDLCISGGIENIRDIT